MSLQYVKMKRDQTELRKRMFEIVNFVNLVSQTTQKKKTDTNHQLVVTIFSYSGGVITGVISLNDTVCFPAGVQTPEDLCRSGGFGDLVQRRPDHRDAAGWSEPGRVHEVEKLGAGEEDKARQRASHQVRTAFNRRLIDK